MRSMFLGYLEKHSTIGMDDAYDDTIDDPTAIHQELHAYRAKFLEQLSSDSHLGWLCPLDQYYIDSFAEMIFESNQIEGVGSTRDITLKLCRAVFKDEHIPKLNPGDEEYQALKAELIRRGKRCSKMKYVLRSRNEIIQHAAAARDLIENIAISGAYNREDVISYTHQFLTHRVDAAVGFPWTVYSGVYRPGDDLEEGSYVLMDSESVPKAMKKMGSDLMEDMAQVDERGTVDPFALAAKHCRSLARIHPFMAANVQLRRLVLNLILLRYGGTVLSLGSGADQDEYLEIETRDDVSDEDRDKNNRVLASLTLRHARDSMRKLTEFVENQGELTASLPLLKH